MSRSFRRIARRATLWLRVSALAAAFMLSALHIMAQASITAPVEVFLLRGSALDTLIFIDTLTGAEVETQAAGERYTIAGGDVIYFDASRGRVMIATPDGSVREHPFIQPTIDSRRVDWTISDDMQWIAWTLTSADTIGRLSTVTTTARLDGTEPRRVLVDGPNSDGLRAMPLGFNPSAQSLFMAMQPDGLNDFMPVTQYGQLFTLDVITGDRVSLIEAGEPICLCGADFRAGKIVRLVLSASQQGFDVRVTDTQSGSTVTIPSLALEGYTQAGDVLISPDGRRAVYALVQILNFGTASPQTIFVLVDLVMLRQEALTRPITTLVRPLEWTEDNTAILFTSPNQSGTWKINLADGRLERVAEATFIGTLMP